VDVLVDVVELLEVVVVGPFGMHVQGAKSVVPPHV